MLEWNVVLELVSPNQKEHWSKTYARNKKNERILGYHWMMTDEKPKVPCTVHLERVIFGRMKPMDDDDNLRMAFKNVKDVISNFLVPGLKPGHADDPKHGIKWKYLQSRGDESISIIKFIEKK